MRTYTYVDDLIEGIYRLMHSDLEGAVNIGSAQRVSVKELVDTVAGVAGKTIDINYIDGPVGVQARNHSNDRIYSLGWECRHDLEAGIAKTYPWIRQQVETATAKGKNF